MAHCHSSAAEGELPVARKLGDQLEGARRSVAPRSSLDHTQATELQPATRENQSISKDIQGRSGRLHPTSCSPLSMDEGCRVYEPQGLVTGEVKRLLLARVVARE